MGRLAAIIIVLVVLMPADAGGSSMGTSARLRVVRCPTSYGGQAQRGPAVPAAVPVAGRAAGLAAYSNGWLTAVAPRGWHCSGGVGADGNESLAVLPPYVMAVSASAAAVTLYRTWNGVAISIACGYFPELARGYAVPCTAIPRRELVYRLSARSVAFEDPPGVQGTGDPSGGALPANGVVAYTYQGTGPPLAQLMVGSATCTLPQSEHALCTTILNDFLARWKALP